MAANTKLLQGEVSNNPQELDLDVERLLAGFLRSLLDERRGVRAQPATGLKPDAPHIAPEVTQ
ncbi:hypothetical protein WDW86_09760 [Bdellovibrionota bacterium FG-2]